MAEVLAWLSYPVWITRGYLKWDICEMIRTWLWGQFQDNSDFKDRIALSIKWDMNMKVMEQL